MSSSKSLKDLPRLDIEGLRCCLLNLMPVTWYPGSYCQRRSRATEAPDAMTLSELEYAWQSGAYVAWHPATLSGSMVDLDPTAALRITWMKGPDHNASMRVEQVDGKDMCLRGQLTPGVTVQHMTTDGHCTKDGLPVFCRYECTVELPADTPLTKPGTTLVTEPEGSLLPAPCGTYEEQAEWVRNGPLYSIPEGTHCRRCGRIGGCFCPRDDQVE